ncbi:hypothetical protein FAZ78_15090 [Cereibacter changlensis]|uniref:Uncharacterized protein n=1 Tax=Cereibacter changlensis TaxID=402884 RepID=A0A2W7RL73_9RHOB|nr:hypothetical protein [Cereibacter changlensis]PZX56317.1 hypothetical protein LX76_01346 [Cereibacter changlensis]TKA95766.1 hypothetical protein FAZ78_15090 [Cereibacter changlensis]
MPTVTAVTRCAEGETRTTMEITPVQACFLPNEPGRVYVTDAGDPDSARELSRDELIMELARLE